MNTLNNINFFSYQNDTFKYFSNGVIEEKKNMTCDEVIETLNSISNTLKCIYHLVEYFIKDYTKSISKLEIQNDKIFLKGKFRDLENSLNFELEKNLYLSKNPLEFINFKNKKIYYIPLIKLYLENDKFQFVFLQKDELFKNDENHIFEFYFDLSNDQNNEHLYNLLHFLNSSFNLVSSKINYLKIGNL